MRLSNGFVIDKEKTFGELKFTAVRDVFLQNEDGTPSTQLKKRIYDLKCSLHGGLPAFWFPLFFNTISSAFTYQSTSAPV